jgi:hypothetical protein
MLRMIVFVYDARQTESGDERTRGVSLRGGGEGIDKRHESR